jgi:metal-sulfur cluster biosynthetic enzyme
MATTMPDEDAVRHALMQVDDPEAGMNIVDLGLIYGIVVGEDSVDVEMTMTTPACPVTEMLVDEACLSIEQIVPHGTAVNVRLVWDPPWNPSMMSDVARGHFGWS